MSPFRSRLTLALVLGGAFSAVAAPMAPTADDPAAGMVVTRAELSPATEEAFLRLYFPADQLVESATRNPKPISQIAENVSVVTAREIEAMNAHTVAEVLNRVTGVFVDFWGHDFGSFADIDIHASDNTHVTVLLDGVPLNLHLNGEVGTDQVPVGIIDRIEVVKGPASSAWGSALGGVINIITKSVGRVGQGAGQVSASYGEDSSHDLRAEARGGLGPLGVYLQAGKLGSQGLVADRGATNANAFAKLTLAPGGAWIGTLTLHHSAPFTDLGDTGDGYTFDGERRTSLVRLDLDGTPAPGWDVNLALYRYDQVVDLSFEALDGSWSMFPVTDEDTVGAQGRVVHALGPHTLVLGADYLLGGTNRDDFTGTEANRERAGFYGNTTLVWGDWALTPGLRLDRDSRVDPFWSPSVGLTWQACPTLLLRGSIARGFRAPDQVSVVGFPGWDPNPALDPEQIWSWQGGVETTSIPGLWLKLTGFRHKVTDAFADIPNPDTGNSITVNRSWEWRTGGEAELETAPFHGLSGRSGFGFSRDQRAGVTRNTDRYTWDLILRYLRGPFGAELAGHYVWWDQAPAQTDHGEYSDFLWDLNLRHRVVTRSWGEVELFGTIHDLFNGTQYYTSSRPDPSRWVEAGVRLDF